MSLNGKQPCVTNPLNPLNSERSTCFIVGNISECRRCGTGSSNWSWSWNRNWFAGYVELPLDSGWERQKTLITLSYVTFLYLSHQVSRTHLLPTAVAMGALGGVAAAVAVIAILQYFLLSFWLCLLSLSLFCSSSSSRSFSHRWSRGTLSHPPAQEARQQHMPHTPSSEIILKSFCDFFCCCLPQHKRDFSLLLSCVCVCCVTLIVSFAIVNTLVCVLVFCVSLFTRLRRTAAPLSRRPDCGCVGRKLHFCKNKWKKQCQKQKHFSI